MSKTHVVTPGRRISHPHLRCASLLDGHRLIGRLMDLAWWIPVGIFSTAFTNLLMPGIVGLLKFKADRAVQNVTNRPDLEATAGSSTIVPAAQCAHLLNSVEIR